MSAQPFATRAQTAPAAGIQTAAAPAAAPRPASPAHLDSILQIPVAVQVSIGSAAMPIASLMALERGAIVPLDHDISDPVDVVVNGRVIARGELVALDDDPSKIGVKLTEIIGQPDTGA